MHTKKDIETREDIKLLVYTFYDKIKLDNHLGYIFNQTIQEEWPLHLEKLIDFWESLLFGVSKYTGRPGYKHLMVDANFGNIINKSHFDQWVFLWHETCDILFEGERTEEAKMRATRIGEAQLHHIERNRFKK